VGDVKNVVAKGAMMTTEEFTLPADFLHYYATLGQWMAVRADIWHEVDVLDLLALQVGELGGVQKNFEDLYEFAKKVDELIKQFFGMTDSELCDWRE
jgi:hypothetical protein